MNYFSFDGGRLREERQRLDLDQAAMGLACGVSREMLGKYERGVAAPGADVLAALLGQGVDVTYLLSGERTVGKPGLTSDEQVLLDYFRTASKEIRRAAIAMLAGAQPTPPRGPSTAVHIAGDVIGGQHNHTHAAGSVGAQYGKTIVKGKKRSE